MAMETPMYRMYSLHLFLTVGTCWNHSTPKSFFHPFVQALRYMSWTPWACWRFPELICCCLFLLSKVHQHDWLEKKIVLLVVLMIINV